MKKCLNPFGLVMVCTSLVAGGAAWYLGTINNPYTISAAVTAVAAGIMAITIFFNKPYLTKAVEDDGSKEPPGSGMDIDGRHPNYSY